MSVLWTSEENARLCSLRRRYSDVAEVAAEMPGRTANACRQHARLLGVPFTLANPRPRWNAYTSDLLRHYWNVEGLTASQCAKRLGISRNAVIGRAHRMGLDKRASPIIRHEPRMEQRPDTCAWLDGTGPYTPCTASPAPGRPYCTQHCERAFEKKPPKKDKAVFVTTADRTFGMVF